MENTNLASKRSRKKTLSAVLVLLLAVALICGSLFAFFSDRLGSKSTIMAGTLDIVDTTSVDQPGNGYVIKRLDTDDSTWKDYNPDTDIINPGDIFCISVGVKNKGSKSAWLGVSINFDFENGNSVEQGSMLKDNTKFYSSYENLESGTDPITIGSTGYGKNLAILDGSKEFEENRTQENAATTYDGEILYFTLDGENTKNAAQGGKIGIDVVIKAIQYRNNTTAIEDDEWINLDVEDSSTISTS